MAFAFAALSFSAPASALVCPPKDPTGSIECVNAGSSWCGNTCKTEPSCSGSQYVKSYFSAAQCAPCVCACQPGQLDCAGYTTVCQDPNATCAGQNKVQACSTGTQATCGACVAGFTMCGSTCLPTTSGSCIAPAVYDACTGTCTHPYILVSPATTQPATIDTVGTIRLGGDLFSQTSGKAVRVDSAVGGTTWNVGNWGGASGNPNFTVVVNGKLETEGTLQTGLNSPSLVDIGAVSPPARNLFYANMANGSVGNLLRMQRQGAGNDKFIIDADGNIIVGSIPSGTMDSQILLSQLATSDVAGKTIVTAAGTNSPAYVAMSSGLTLLPSGVVTMPSAPTFSTSVTAPTVTSAGPLTVRSTGTAALTDDIILKTAGVTQLQVYESGGIGVGSGSLALGATGNLIYGNISASSAAGADLLQLQNGSVDKFVVDLNGQLTVGSVPWTAMGATTPTVSCSGENYIQSFDGTSYACSSVPASPTGTLNQTVRSDGSNWVGSSFLVNDGTYVGINMGGATLTKPLEVRDVIQTSTGTATSQASSRSRSDNGVLLGLFVGGSTNPGSMFGTSDRNLAAVTDTGSVIAPSALTLGSFWNVPLIFGTDNAEALRITGAGNVGLGATTPATIDGNNRPVKLDVRGGLALGNSSTLSFFPSSGSVTYPAVRASSLNQLEFCDPGNAWGGCLLDVNGVTVASFASAGVQFGNGANDPVYRLEAHADSAGTADVERLVNAAASATDNGARLLLVDRTADFNQQGMGGIAGLMTSNVAGSHNGALLLSAANLGSLAAERVRVDAAGMVGIGTNAPAAQLHVYQNSASVNAELAIQSGNGTTAQNAWKIYQNGSAGELAYKQLNITANGGVSLALKADAVGTVQISTPQISAGAGTVDYVLAADSQGFGTWKQPSQLAADYCLAAKYSHLTPSGTKYDGNMGGYRIASSRCSAVVANSHICTPDELARTVECMRTAGAGYTAKYGAPVPPTDNSIGWVAGGPSGYTAPAANDCTGFTSNSTATYGEIWTFASVGDGYTASTACNVAKQIVCCK